MDAGTAAGRPHWPEELRRQRRRLQELFDGVTYRAALGATLTDWGPGWSIVTATPTAALTNLAGTVHGGLLAGLADLAFEVACNSYGRLCVATELTVHYAAATPPGTPLQAEAVEVTRSRRIASYRITVTAPDRTIAWCQAIAYRTDTWHGGDRDYPDPWRQQY